MGKKVEEHSTNFRYDKTRNFGVNYVFRSLRDDEPAENRSIVAKNPNQDYHPNAQVCKGNSLPTQWISATKSLGVALQYGVKNVVINEGQKPNIAIIKVDNAGTQVIDVQLHNKGNEWKKNPMANCFARRSQEVLFEKNIDKSAVIAIIGEKERKKQFLNPKEIDDLKKMGADIMDRLAVYHQNINLLYGDKNNPKMEQNLLANFNEAFKNICSKCDELAYKYVRMNNSYMVDLIYEGGFNVLKEMTETAIDELKTIDDKEQFFDYEVTPIKDTRGFDYEPEVEEE